MLLICGVVPAFPLFIYLFIIPPREEFCPADVPPSPDISHLEFCSPTSHLLRMYHIRNFVPPTFYLLRMSHIQNSVTPTFRLLRMPHIRNSVSPTFRLLRIFHIRRLTPDGRGGRFNFPGQTCPDPLIVLTQRASSADNLDSPDSLAR